MIYVLPGWHGSEQPRAVCVDVVSLQVARFGLQQWQGSYRSGGSQFWNLRKKCLEGQGDIVSRSKGTSGIIIWLIGVCAFPHDPASTAIAAWPLCYSHSSPGKDNHSPRHLDRICQSIFEREIPQWKRRTVYYFSRSVHKVDQMFASSDFAALISNLMRGMRWHVA